MSSARDNVVRSSSSREEEEKMFKELFSLPDRVTPPPTTDPGPFSIVETDESTVLTRQEPPCSSSATVTKMDVEVDENLVVPVPAQATTTNETDIPMPAVSAASSSAVSSFFAKKIATSSQEEKKPVSNMRIEKKTSKISQNDPGSKSIQRPSESADVCLIDADSLEEMSIWLNENAGKYTEFSKKDKNLALDLLNTFKDSLPCLKCGCQHAFTFNGVSSMQFKAAKATGKECSMSVLNIVHSMPPAIIKLLVDAVSMRLERHHLKNFISWACSTQKSSASTALFYEAAYMTPPTTISAPKETVFKKLPGSPMPESSSDNEDDDITMQRTEALPPTPEAPVCLSGIVEALNQENLALRQEIQRLRTELQEARAREDDLTGKYEALIKSQADRAAPKTPSFADAISTPVRTSPSKKLKAVPREELRASPEKLAEFNDRYQDLQPSTEENPTPTSNNEKYANMKLVNDDFFAPPSPVPKPVSGNLKFIYFRGPNRLQPSRYRALFSRLGLPAHLIRDISFLSNDLMMLLTYDSLVPEIVSKLLEFGNGRYHYLPDADPTDSSLFPELGAVSSDNLKKAFFESISFMLTNFRNKLTSHPVLTKTVQFLEGVLESKNPAFMPSLPKPKAFFMNRFWVLDEKLSDAEVSNSDKQ